MIELHVKRTTRNRAQLYFKVWLLCVYWASSDSRIGFLCNFANLQYLRIATFRFRFQANKTNLELLKQNTNKLATMRLFFIVHLYCLLFSYFDILLHTF